MQADQAKLSHQLASRKADQLEAEMRVAEDSAAQFKVSVRDDLVRMRDHSDRQRAELAESVAEPAREQNEGTRWKMKMSREMTALQAEKDKYRGEASDAAARIEQTARQHAAERSAEAE